MNSADHAQDCLRPRSLAEALERLASGGRRILAGGTDLYPGAGSRLPGPTLDLMGLADMAGIEMTRQGLRIGATTTWTTIAEAGLPPALWALRGAARQIGGRQVQNAATIGGNLCNASPAADGAVALMALGAGVELASSAGRRRLALGAFLLGPRRTALRPDEILTAVLIPEGTLRGRSGFVKLGARSHLVISIAMVAARVVVEAGFVAEASVAVGACTPVAVRLPLVEAALAGASVGTALARIRADEVTAALSAIDDDRATAAYRHEAAVVLVRRAVAGALA
jgi:CO/xanthine dehydrogenase FAD-binding subunit